MPKRIDNAQEKILDAAKAEIRESGFEKLGLRKIALRSNLAVGTIYHYYPDKLHLIAALILDGWNKYESRSYEAIQESSSLSLAFLSIYETIHSFANEYSKAFASCPGDFFHQYYQKEHPAFVQCISRMIRQVMLKFSLDWSDTEIDMLSELFISSLRNPRLAKEDFLSCLLNWLK